MWKNYRAYHGDYDQEDFQKFCDPLGLDVGKGKDYVQAFNHIHNKIDVLSGEESKRPWNYHVLSMAPETTNRILREREQDYRRFVDGQLGSEIQKVQQQAQMEMQMQNGQMSEEQAQQAQQQLQQKIDADLKMIMTPELIEKKYEDFKTAEEQALTKIMKRGVRKDRLKHLKNEAFYNGNIAGLEYVGAWMQNGTPKVEVLNPLGVAYHKSPEVQFIQDGEFVVYKREMTIGDIMDTYGRLMSSKDLKRLDDYTGNVYGLNAMKASKSGFSPSHFEHIQYKSQIGGNFGSGDVLHDGQYGQSSKAVDDYQTVYTCFWRSQRRMGFITWRDEYNKEQSRIVSEEFVLPEHAKKKTERVHGVTKTVHMWIEEGLQHELRWEWAPEIWWGTRIQENIFCQVEPYPYAYQTSSDPYDVKLPIYGAVYSATNAPVTSTADRMMPWQKLYLMIMSKFLKLIGLDKGQLTFLNTLMLDKDIGVDMTLKYAEDTGVIPYNPLQNKETMQLGNTLKVAEAVNMSNSQQIGHYAEILRFVESNIGLAAGISPQREAQTASNTNVSDNLRDVAQSAIITETKFALHDLLWGEVLNAYLKLLQHEIQDKEPEYLRYWLSDREIATLDMRELNLSDLDTAVIVEDNAQTHRHLEALKQQAHGILQNEERALSKLVRLLPAESIVEFREYMDEIEDKIQEAKAQIETANAQAQEKTAKMQIDHREDEQAHEIELKRMEIQGKIAVVEKQAELNDTEADYTTVVASAKSDVEKMQIEREKLDQKDRDAALKQAQADKDREVDREKIKSQEKIARMKPPKPSPKK